MFNRLQKLIDNDFKDNILLKKNEVNDILFNTLKSISFNHKNTTILGSYKMRSQLYTSDIDCFEVVSAKATTIKSSFQRKIRKLLHNNNIYIGDIKVGVYEPFRIIDETAFIHKGKVYRYNYSSSKKKLDELYKGQILSKAEYEEADKLLVPTPNENQLNDILKMLRFHILRWKPQDIINGYVKLRNGKKYDLLQAIRDPSLFKMDVIRYDGYKFIDISIIYDVRNKDNIKIKMKSYNTRDTLKNDIAVFLSQGQYFKVLKRMYSLYKYDYNYGNNKKDNMGKIVVLTKILNSQMGQMYQVKSMLDVLVFLFQNFKNISRERVESNINTIIDKLSYIYDRNYVAVEKDIISDLLLILRDKGVNEKKLLLHIYNTLDDLLNKKAKQYVEAIIRDRKNK